MKNNLTRLKFFLIPLLLWIATWAILIFLIPKGELELSWNQHHTKIADIFFSTVTFFGDGFFYAGFVLVMLFINRIWFYISLISSLLCAAVSNLFKHFIFKDEQRPLSFFGDSVHIHLPEGTQPLFWGSFPSGHTLAAFSMFLLAAYFFRKPGLQYLFFASAVLTGISRIYLMAHFKEDVLTGSVIGATISFCMISLFTKTSLKNTVSPELNIKTDEK